MKKICFVLCFCCLNSFSQSNSAKNHSDTDTITVAGGCYWCVEAVYENLKGVQTVVSGFCGGKTSNPSYEAVSSGETGHAEAVQITFNTKETSVTEILKVFFSIHDPTTRNKQGADEGTQYRSAIFYKNTEQKQLAQNLLIALSKAKVFSKTIVTTLEPLSLFYKAKSDHQNYYQNNKNAPYCQLVIVPKLEKFEKIFKNKIKAKQ